MTTMAMAWQTKPHPRYPRVANTVGNGILYPWVSDDDEVQAKHVSINALIPIQQDNCKHCRHLKIRCQECATLDTVSQLHAKHRYENDNKRND